jgi:hypothetical protein
LKNLQSFILNNVSIIKNKILDLTSTNITNILAYTYQNIGIIEAFFPKSLIEFQKDALSGCLSLKRVIIESDISKFPSSLF